MPQFWKVRHILFWEGRILQNSPQKLGEFPPHSFSHLSWFEVPPMLGVWDIINLSGGPIRLTNYNFHTHVQYWITIHYHICSIDKYRNVEGPKCHNFGKARNILFPDRRALQNSSQKLGEFPPHSFSHLSWFEVPPMPGVWNIINLSGDLSDWPNYNFHAHEQYCITFHYQSCSIDKCRNVEGPKFHNLEVGISHFESKGFVITPKAVRVSLTCLLPSELMRFLRVWDIPGDLSNWQIITSMHMYSIV